MLTNDNIRKIISKNKGIIIMNMHDQKPTAVGYDFRIGFICDADSGEKPKKIEVIYDKTTKKEYKKRDFDNTPELSEEYKKFSDSDRYRLGYRYALLSGHRYLVISEEYIALMHKYMATLHSRASYALKGIVVTSTTIDPNYKGFIYASLMNCSKNDVYIKEHNQFVTMVVHKLTAATNMQLPKNEDGMPMDAEQTLSGSFSNICEKAVSSARAYRLDAWKEIEQEFGELYVKSQNNRYVMKHLIDWGPHIGNFMKEIFSKSKFWFVVGAIVLFIIIYFLIGKEEAFQAFQMLLQ